MKKENQKALPLLALLLAAAAILLVFAAPARAGAKAGLALAENTVLPSLLPLLMLFLMIQNTRAGVLLSRALTLPAKALRLPPQAAGALLFGQIGGYPTGAVLTGELLDRGVIDRATARRMLCFNVCGGVGRAVRAALSDLFGLPRRGCTFGRRLLPGAAAPVSPTGGGVLQYIGDPASPRYRQHHADSAAAGRRCGICA